MSDDLRMKSVNPEEGTSRKLELTTLEKGVVGLFSGLALVGFVWMATTLNLIAVEQGKQSTALEFIKEDASEASRDRFTQTEADVQFKEINRRITILEAKHGG